MWIEKKDKFEYINSSPSNGIKTIFADSLEEKTIIKIKKFVLILRKSYFFPIRCNIFFCDNDKFIHPDDGHIYYGVFFDNKKTLEKKRRLYPQIYIPAKVSDSNSIVDVCFALIHELTHYYQWYFLEDEKRTDRSLEIEANRWARYLLECFKMMI